PAPAAPQGVRERAAPPPVMFAAKPADEPAYAAASAPAAPPPVVAAGAYAPAAPASASQATSATQATSVPQAASAPIGAEEPVTTGTFTPPRPSSPPALQGAPAGRARMAAKGDTAVSADCPLPVLEAVLADVEAKFGAVTVVATHQHKTVNHVAGSAREKLHHDCKAIDFRPERSHLEEIKAYLRGRPEIAGLDSYRDGVIHMDVAGRAFASPTRRPAAAARAQAGRDAVEAGL
ncbi:MAG TPA: D-Ala-D-Ala carboxypeptidase family metallohydrolase, partial [Beijerinckiaceae bacterium]|nr:D-Ala-D-Ala carboxypeptidase family metallohydrolase [Beijerinckiaceae bacterium]